MLRGLAGFGLGSVGWGPEIFWDDDKVVKHFHVRCGSIRSNQSSSSARASPVAVGFHYTRILLLACITYSPSSCGFWFTNSAAPESNLPWFHWLLSLLYALASHRLGPNINIQLWLARFHFFLSFCSQLFLSVSTIIRVPYRWYILCAYTRSHIYTM